MIFRVFRVILLLVLPIPPPARELRAILIKLTTPTGEQYRLRFNVHVLLFHALPTLRGGMPMAFVDGVFLSLKARLSFLFLL